MRIKNFTKNPQETANLVTFTEEILNRKTSFLCRACTRLHYITFPTCST